MCSRDYYKVSYGNRNDSANAMDSHEILDNETEFNANQFKLFDDFTTDLRIGYNPMRHNYHEITRTDSRRRTADPNDSGVDMENGNPHDDAHATNDTDLLENEVMVDPWSSMDSSNSPLTDSGPSASEDCTPSSSEPLRGPLDASSPLSTDARRVPNSKDAKTSKYIPPETERARSRDLTLELETLDPDPLSRRPHFLDDDFQSSSKSNIECRIPKPHFLDHSPSPDEFDERSDITNPNFLDDEVDGDDSQSQRKAGALPKRPQKASSTTYSPHEDRPHRTSYRTSLHYGLESAARSSERDKRASALYRGTWPGDRDVWTARDTASVRSFSSNGSADGTRPSSHLENKMECVCSLISLLSLSPENNADLSGPLLDMSRSVESCIAMRQAGCIPLLVQLIHSKVPRETRDRAAKALRNIIHTQTDDKAGRREARVWRLLEQVREYCYVLEDLVESRKEGKEVLEDDATKHPSQSVAALMKLSFDEEHRHVVCQLGGLQALAALVSGDQAAHGSRTDDNTCLTMRKYAGMTLTNLTFGDGNNKSLLCSFKDFMTALVEQLESPNDDMRQVTAAVLRNLSWRADTGSKLVLREVGAVKGLTKAAMTCQKEATLKSVLSALWNLTAHCSMNKVALCSVGGALGFLVDMLSYNSPTKTLAIVENAGGIMRNVSSHIAVREDYRLILRERNCLSVLLQHLKSPSLTVVSNSCGTLWNLSARCPSDQQFLWERGAVPMLRSLVHSKHKMIAMGSAAALKNLLNSKPGKSHVVCLDATARTMNLPQLPTLGARKQKALDQELDQNLAETCDNIEPATSPSTSNREEKNLFTATERQIAMSLERHRMTSSSPLMGTLASQISLSHSAHLATYLSCSNTLLKGTGTLGSAGDVNRSDSKDSVTSAHSDSVFERAARPGKVPVPTPRNRHLVQTETGSEAFKTSKRMSKDGTFPRYPIQPPIPPPRSAELRTNYAESGFDVDQESCDQPVDYSRKYSETKTADPEIEKPKTETKKYSKKESGAYGDYQETDLDQPTDYSLRYAERHSEAGSDEQSPHEDTIQHFATEGTPLQTPVGVSTATSMSDLRLIGRDKPKLVSSVKENPEVMTHSDEKDTCSIEDPPRHDNDLAAPTPQSASLTERGSEKRGVFDTKFSSGMISPEKPVNYCDEGTPGCFSRVSSLSSLGEPTEEDSLAKRNAMATIHVDPTLPDHTSTIAKDKEGCKAVTFATSPPPPGVGGGAGSGGATPARYVEETPLMFSRSSSLGSLPECEQDDHGSVVSEVSRLTSGCISPSEIPDSPGGASSPLHSHHHHQPQGLLVATPPRGGDSERGGGEEEGEEGEAGSELGVQVGVEDTPARLSAGTSLSSLTIDGEHTLHKEYLPKLPRVRQEPSDGAASPRLHTALQLDIREPIRPVGISTPMRRDHIAEAQTPSEVCCVYYTEDTPAILSKAGSNSDLSALSIEGEVLPPAPCPAPPPPPPAPPRESPPDSSDSSNLSDAGSDLLEECIQKGIAKVVKNKAPPSETSPTHHYRDDVVYRSLPAYLRSSTESVASPRAPPPPRGHTDSSRSGSPCGATPPLPPPPLPPRAPALQPPPRPRPALLQQNHEQGRKHESRLPVKSERPSRSHVPGPALAPAPPLARTDSLSSLSVESFGSTDREIFEETVQAGLSSVNPRGKLAQRAKGKAHSVERAPDFSRLGRHHRSLERSDNIPQLRSRLRDPEFDKNLAAGAYDLMNLSRGKEPVNSSWYGESNQHQARFRSARRGEEWEGPASLPTAASARSEEQRRALAERSTSLSSLSNDSFGSTDKEVFERCVRAGMGKPPPNKRDDKIRVRSDDRLEGRDHRRRRREPRGALDKMVGEDSKDRAILEEVIARGAGEHKQSKNVPEPSAEAAAAGGLALTALTGTGSDPDPQPDLTTRHVFLKDNELPTVHSANTTLDSNEETEMERSNECLAPESANTTIDSEKDELNRSNESYADVMEESSSDPDPDPDPDPEQHSAATLTRNERTTLEWTDIKYTCAAAEGSRREDTWNENTCPDDVTFPTISGSVHMVSSIRSEVTEPEPEGGAALPDLLEASEARPPAPASRPDLTDTLEHELLLSQSLHVAGAGAGAGDADRLMLDSVPEPSFASLLDEHKLDSILAAEIEKEAARLAAMLKTSHYDMEASVASVASLDLDHVKPPSDLGSLLSLSASGLWEDTHTSKRGQRSRKKSLPVALMVKRALGNSMQHDSSERLDSAPHSFLENVKPPSEMERVDMEGSMVSVSSIVSEVADGREARPPLVFDFKEPVRDFPPCHAFPHLFQDLDKVNPPSLFDEMAESTLEIDQTTAHLVYEESTLNVVTDIPSGSERCTPLPSDGSSVESTPKRQRHPDYLTPKEKRLVAKDRYQTYTITDTHVQSEPTPDLEEDFLTWTKSESVDERLPAVCEQKGRRRVSAKQRRLEDRARYQTQIVEIHAATATDTAPQSDPRIENLRRRLADKKSVKQRRVEEAERFRTRTLSEDVPPSPADVCGDVSCEVADTSTGYDSLSSGDGGHQALPAAGHDDDSGHHEEDDLCLINNLRNAHLTASARLADRPEYTGCSGDPGEAPPPPPRAAPRVVKPTARRDLSLDSNDSVEEPPPKALRGRKKPAYVSPYRRSAPATASARKAPATAAPRPLLPAHPKPSTPLKAPHAAGQTKTPGASRAASAVASPKKSFPYRSPPKPAPKVVAIPPGSAKPLPLERQGTFTKEESSVPAQDLPIPEAKPAPSSHRSTKSAPHTKAPTSPSRLPQLHRPGRPPATKPPPRSPTKGPNKSPTKTVKKPDGTMKNSPSNHSLQSNDSGKTITIASRSSRQGSASSVNSTPSAKDVESKIASLWKKVEQAKRQPAKGDKRVWIESDETEQPRLIRSSTFEGQPKQAQLSPATKQKSAIGIRVSQIPSLRPKSSPSKPPPKKPAQPRLQPRKPAGGQLAT